MAAFSSFLRRSCFGSRWSVAAVLASVVALTVARVALDAQAPPIAPAVPRTLYDRYTEPIQIFKVGLGSFSRKISTTNAEAQAYFDQGFQMMYAFAKPEAVRSFREAW